MEAADGQGAPALSPSRLLHPGVLFVVLWVAVLATWALTPEATFLRSTSSEKYVSTSAIAFVLLALAAFAVGTVVGPLMFPRTTVRLRVADLRPDVVALLDRGTQLIFAAGAVATLYVLFAGIQRAGGLSALLASIQNGVAWSTLAENYFKPARIALVTVWLHLIVAAAPLSVVTAIVTRERAIRRRQLVILAAGFILALLLSFAFAERLIVFAYVVSAAVAWGATRVARRARPLRLLGARRLVTLALAALVLSGLWVFSEISRTYLATRQTNGPLRVSDIEAGTPLAAQTFLAYVTTSANNGMYAVDHTRSYAYMRASLAALVTTLGWDQNDGAPVVGPGNADAERLLHELYPYNNPLTTFSLPGDAFMDLGWTGAIVVFWFGAGLGALFDRFRSGEFWALLVYPLGVVGILDSYRIAFWTTTNMVVPVLGIALLMGRVYRLAAPGAAEAPQFEASWRAT
jgi:oligosaccharide repeat unit polymerase